MMGELMGEFHMWMDVFVSGGFRWEEVLESEPTLAITEMAPALVAKHTKGELATAAGLRKGFR